VRIIDCNVAALQTDIDARVCAEDGRSSVAFHRAVGKR
jgi:hypothetical protein